MAFQSTRQGSIILQAVYKTMTYQSTSGLQDPLSVYQSTSWLQDHSLSVNKYVRRQLVISHWRVTRPRHISLQAGYKNMARLYTSWFEDHSLSVYNRVTRPWTISLQAGYKTDLLIYKQV